MDDELRELERLVREGRGSRVAWARALERLGRVEEAVAALLPGLDEPEARLALGRLPFPAELVREPSLLWERELARSGLGEIAEIAASPLGVAFPSRDPWVLDPRTGNVRFQARGELVGIEGDVLFLGRDEVLAAVDVWTGEPIRSSETGRVLAVGDGLVVGETRTWALPEPRGLLGASFSHPRVSRATIAGGRVFVRGGQVVALDREGRELWRSPGELVDASAFHVLLRTPLYDLVLVDAATGAIVREDRRSFPTWRALAAALLPGKVVVQRSSLHEVETIIEDLEGEDHVLVNERGRFSSIRTLMGVRGGFYAWELGHTSAFGLDGRLLWERNEPSVSLLASAAPLGKTLLVSTGDVLRCFGSG